MHSSSGSLVIAINDHQIVLCIPAALPSHKQTLFIYQFTTRLGPGWPSSGDYCGNTQMVTGYN
jgi:hypothetical protein